MLALIGIIALVPLSVRVAMWGRRRALPRRWLAWTPFTSLVVWAAGCVATTLAFRHHADTAGELPAGQRADALSNGIAQALQFTLAGGIAAVVVLVLCFAFFATRPPLGEFGSSRNSQV
jgi:hypothetical protein